MVMILQDTPDDDSHDRFPPLQGAFRLARRNRSMGAEHALRIPHLAPGPSHGPRCIAGRLRRRGAMLRETPPSPPRGGRGALRQGSGLDSRVAHNFHSNGISDYRALCGVLR
jgi:hypothetical protein